MLRAMSYTGIIAIGMGLCLMSGIIDLSVGATAGLSSVAFGALLVNYHLALIPSILLTLLIGGLVGAFNALIIIRMKITPFIATISSMFMVKGIALAWNKGFLFYPLPKGISDIGMLKPLGVSIAFICLLVVAVIAWLVLEKTVFGLEVRATGSDYEVAKVTEVRYRLVHTALLIAVGVLAAVSGIFLSFVLNAGSPNVGDGWEFAAITACAIGGISLFGYEGSIPGIFLGLLVIQVLSNGIVMIGVSAFFQQVVLGAVLLSAIILDVKRRAYLNLEKI
jgi:ribose transport system permease protein